MANVSIIPKSPPLSYPQEPEPGAKKGKQETDHGDFHKLISSLPKGRGHASLETQLVFYRNFWCSTAFLPGAHHFCHRFLTSDSHIILASKPKSGTTWLKALAFSTLRRSEFPPSSPNHPLMSSNPHGLVHFLESGVYGDDGELLDMATFPTPRLFATHIPYDSLPESIHWSACRVVYISRNPLDTIVSLREFPALVSAKSASGGMCSMEEFVDYCCRGIETFGPFWEHLLGYWKASLERPKKVLFIKYEDMKEDPAGNLKMIAEFIGFPFSEEEEKDGVVEKIVGLCSLSSLKEFEVNKTGKPAIPNIQNNAYFRKGEVGDWVNHLTPSMAEKLERVMEEKLSPQGLDWSIK